MSVSSSRNFPVSLSNSLRPFDSARDLGAVADLVELCFADTLDESGRSYVRRMRSAAKSSSLLGWPGMNMGGFVWEQNGSVVGNVTLIPFFSSGSRNFLIANVAVHPDFRRQGIARRLTVQAIEHIQKQGIKTVWLHVRQENEAAVSLYQSLDFAERLRRTTWMSSAELPMLETHPGITLGAARGRDWELQRQWLSANYPPEVAWQSPLTFDSLRPGFLGSLHRLFYSLFTLQWSVWMGNELAASISWQASMGAANSLWLAASPDANEDALRLLLLHARRQAPSKRPLDFDYPAGQSNSAIKQAGFIAQQTLIWMARPL